MGDSEAFTEAFTLIQDWKPKSEVWALRFFGVGTSLTSALSAAYINGHYRNKVKLRNKVLMGTTVPVVFLPMLVSTLLHHQFVLRPLVLQKFQCPVCLEIRGAAIQFGSGFVYPMVLGPVAAFHFANTLYTYQLPAVTNPKALFQTFIKLTRPIFHKLSILAGLQLVVGAALTHAEAHNLFTMMARLSSMEMQVNEHKEEQRRSAHN